MSSIASIRQSRWWGRLGVAWAVLLAVGLACLFRGFRELNVDAFVALGWRQIVYNIPVLVVVFLATKVLIRLHPWFSWKPSDLIFGFGTDTDSLLVKAMKARWIGPVVTVLLVMNLPIIAMLEEFIFRNGTNGWRSAALRSMLFGLAHLTANVPVGASIAVGFTGFWFSLWYFEGGLELAANMHFGYVLLIIGLSAPAIIWQHIRPKTP